jgi:aminoglycoside phosphotransferase (APT) family kinase protein
VTIADVVETQLLATLQQAHPDVPLRYDGEPSPLLGGFYAQMFRFRLVDPPAALEGDLVARIVPNPDLAIWESTIQRNVAAAGFPTPAVRLTVGPESPLGRFLIVMDLATGRPPLDGLGPGILVRQGPKLYRGLPTMLASVTAQLHAIDPAPIEAELRAIDCKVAASAVDLVGALGELAEAFGDEELAAIAGRLLVTAPPTGQRTVCHGDLHPFNLLVDGDHLTLIDWTGGRVADPAYDLAFTELMLANPPIALPPSLTRALRRLTRSLAASFLREYELASGRSIDLEALAWHRAVHALRMLVEVAGWDAAGGRPSRHPFVVLEPVARQVLSEGPGRRRP